MTISLTPAQRTALRGLVAPVLLCCVFSEDFCVCRSPHSTWFLYCPREYAPPEYWSLSREEGEALVVSGLVDGMEVLTWDDSSRVVTTYAITDAGRAAIEGRQKTLRRRKEVSIDEGNGNGHGAGGGSVPRGAGEKRAAAGDEGRALQDPLPL